MSECTALAVLNCSLLVRTALAYWVVASRDYQLDDPWELMAHMHGQVVAAFRDCTSVASLLAGK